ncbi:MAG TPA: peptidase M14 [Calditrichaeota bacterium]|nr:peptidase M14 [Calditrichota bacterium]
MSRHMVLFFFGFIFTLAAADWRTYYEKSGYKATPSYDETVAYCQRLAGTSPQIHFATYGISPQGRPLPLLIIDKNGRKTAQEVRNSSNVVFLIQAGIHSGEIDGKDAGLMLARDIAISGDLAHLIDHVTILFMPIFNVDGHERFGAYNRVNQNGPEEMGWRTTAQNLNLNRDYLKADAPEMQSWLKLYNRWLPEFFADCHVTDGADYQYVLTYKIEQHGILDSSLIKWVEQNYLPPVKTAMQASGFPIIEYVSFRRAHDVESGMTTWATPPRLSDGYTAIQNRPGLLIETHMFKDYKSRVSATYQMLKHTLEVLNKEYKTLGQLIVRADSLTAAPAFRKNPLPLTYKYSKDSTMIDFLGYEYEKVKSDITGGDWYRYFRDKPKTYRIPFFNKMVPDIQIHLPEGYIVPVEWQMIIERIKLHGVAYHELKQPVKLKVRTYKFKNAKWQEKPYEGRHMVQFDMDTIKFERTYYPGSLVLDMNQRTAKVIANMLEPKARDSFVFWGFFDVVFEQKEYIESYVLEEQARLMLANDSRLKKEYLSKIKTDSAFAASPPSIRQWFYERSPYWDRFKNVYPVGRIEDRAVLEKLLKN